MTPAQAIQSATTVASEMMGWRDRIGSIDKASLQISLRSGDPLKDITELERVGFVMKGGQVIGTILSMRIIRPPYGSDRFPR
jgi:imidazolonepropionase-like amidohydrolase